MTNQIQNFLTYLLDSVTTSETAFIETIQNNNELFQSRRVKDWEQTVFRNLQQVHQNANLSPLNNEDTEHKSNSESSDNETSSDDEDEKTSENGHVNIFLS